MRRSARVRPHLEEIDLGALPGRLPRRFAAGQTAADDRDAQRLIYVDASAASSDDAVASVCTSPTSCSRDAAHSSRTLPPRDLATTYEPHTGQRCATTRSHETKSQFG